MQSSIGSPQRRIQMMRHPPPKNLTKMMQKQNNGKKVSRFNQLADFTTYNSTSISTKSKTRSTTSRSKHTKHHLHDDMNQDYAATLLLQMHQIATNEMNNSSSNHMVPVRTTTSTTIVSDPIRSNPIPTLLHPISPLHGPTVDDEKIISLQRHYHHRHNSSDVVNTVSITLPNTPNLTSMSQKQEERSTYVSRYGRFRTVSIGGINDTDVVVNQGNSTNRTWMKINDALARVNQEHGSISPFHLESTSTTSTSLPVLHVSAERCNSIVDSISHQDSPFTNGSTSIVTPNIPTKKVVKLDWKRTNKWLLPQHNTVCNWTERKHHLIQSRSVDEEYSSCDEDDNNNVEVVDDIRRPPHKKNKVDVSRNCVKAPAHHNRISKNGSCSSEESREVAHPVVPSDSQKGKNGTSSSSSPYSPHKYVGNTLSPNVKLRDVLRKKFSWKSFPELETYLIDHRKQYLECSNAMNYTKAQKHYNNELTQGLLQLAADEGYIFEEFTFAAVRDRIRCFYKSFVQATKKKKRQVGHHHTHLSQKNHKLATIVKTYSNDDDYDEDEEHYE